MVLGAAAVVSAARSHQTSSSADATEVVARGAAPATPVVERRVLALLAKPSTERIVFSRSGGRLVLAVGSRRPRGDSHPRSRARDAGQALPRLDPHSGRAPVRVQHSSSGPDAAVFLSAPSVRGSSCCAVSVERPVGKAARSGSSQPADSRPALGAPVATRCFVGRSPGEARRLERRRSDPPELLRPVERGVRSLEEARRRVAVEEPRRCRPESRRRCSSGPSAVPRIELCTRRKSCSPSSADDSGMITANSSPPIRDATSTDLHGFAESIGCLSEHVDRPPDGRPGR